MTFFRNNIKIVLAVVILSLGIVLRDKLEFVYSSFPRVSETKPKEERSGVLTQDRLAQFNGVDEEKLYLAILGSVFDVTEGKKHYEKGSAYNYFVGKDGSRAFVTGDFKDESENKDLVMDLSCGDISSIFNWIQTYRQKYKYLGVVVGTYYNEKGEETEYLKKLKEKVKECESKAKTNENLYPPCNSEWSAESGTVVWCSQFSGGIKRNWVGVPRKMYPEGGSPRCVCLNPNQDHSKVRLKVYKNCSPTAETCSVLETDTES